MEFFWKWRSDTNETVRLASVLTCFIYGLIRPWFNEIVFDMEAHHLQSFNTEWSLNVSFWQCLCTFETKRKKKHRVEHDLNRMFHSNSSRQLQRKPFWVCPLLCFSFQSYRLCISTSEVLLYCIECVLNLRFVWEKQRKGQSHVSVHLPCVLLQRLKRLMHCLDFVTGEFLC